jgi:serine/threonine protein kinase
LDEIAGKYFVERRLGEGGDGRVYLVRHKDLNIRLALKVLEANVSSDPAILEGFKREAEVLFRFSHEGCVQLRDFGSLPDGSYFMATDFCEGGTLRDLLQRTGRLDVRYAVTFLAKILDVLDAAHQLGIVHRDIKPENVMVERDFQGNDKIKVLDFGVAHLLEMEVSARAEQQFGVAGTPQYMSPEQALGEKNLDGRADVYSVGIMAYEMLVGKRPFDNDDLVQILCMQVTQAPEPFPEGFFIPEPIQRVIFQALAKDKSNRFHTASRFKQALLAALEEVTAAPLAVADRDFKDEAKGEPLDQSSEESPAVDERQDFAEKETQPSRKVVLLDDDQGLLNMANHIFSHAGYKIYTARDVAQLHSFLYVNSADILLTDVNMPNMKGTKVCQLLKRGFPQLKVVLFSSIPERDLKKLAQESNADGYLSKQKTPGEWLEYIGEILGT